MREWLKTIRCNNGYSQQAIAEKLGMTQQYYNYIENGERKKELNLSLVIKIADIFKVDINWIADQERQLNKDGGIK